MENRLRIAVVVVHHIVVLVVVEDLKKNIPHQEKMGDIPLLLVHVAVVVVVAVVLEEWAGEDQTHDGDDDEIR